jgi:hypothetical protein
MPERARAGRSSNADATRYARAIERRWADRLAQPVVLSPRDWSRIARWHALGIPLQIVDEAMDAAAARARSRSGRRRLSDLAPLVEEAWTVVLQGRRGCPPPSEPSLSNGPSSRWRHCMREQSPGSPLGRLLGELLDRLAAGDRRAALDDQLDSRLVEAVEPALRERAFEEIASRLEPFRSRMSQQRLEATRRRACVDHLRRLLDLPRLARGDSAT